MKFYQGQIWLVNFDPSFGHEYQKVRPGLIIESNDFIKYGNLITIVPISSKIQKRIKLDINLPKTVKNRLMKDSLIKTQQISSFDKRRFIKFIGNCENHILQSIKKSIKKYFSI